MNYQSAHVNNTYQSITHCGSTGAGSSVVLGEGQGRPGKDIGPFAIDRGMISPEIPLSNMALVTCVVCEWVRGKGPGAWVGRRGEGDEAVGVRGEGGMGDEAGGRQER